MRVRRCDCCGKDIEPLTGKQNDAEMSADEIAKRYLGDGKTVETSFVDEAGDEN